MHHLVTAPPCLRPSIPCDELRISIFKDRDYVQIHLYVENDEFWREAIGNEFKMWCNDRLVVWIKEQPSWFTDQVKSIIPDWIVDNKRMTAKIRIER